MTEENKVLNEEMEQDIQDEETPEGEDPLKKAIEEQMTKLRTQSMLLGAQTACNVILQKMIKWNNQPGKRSLNDHRRLLKEIQEFCEIGISRKVDPDGTTSPIEDDNTKLTEETNESNINESDN